MSEPPVLLVTGGLGYIGRHVLARARGWIVHATWHRLDICDAEAVTALVYQVRPAAILHTAYQFNTPDMAHVITEGARDCTLDTALARRLLRVRLRGVREALAALFPTLPTSPSQH